MLTLCKNDTTTEAQQPQIRTICHHVFHRPCLLTCMASAGGGGSGADGGGGIDHDDCPSCRFAPLYDTKVYYAKMAVAYTNYCVTTAAAPAAAATTGTQQRDPVVVTPSRPPVAGQPSSWYSGLMYCVVLIVVMHMALYGIFVQTRRSSSLRPSSSSFPNDNSNNNSSSSSMEDDFSCNDVNLALGSLTEREVTVYCANNPERPCSICGNGLFQSPVECYCYCRFELQRPNVTAQFTESTQCCQCSSSSGGKSP
jgi:hypothetical protein